MNQTHELNNRISLIIGYMEHTIHDAIKHGYYDEITDDIIDGYELMDNITNDHSKYSHFIRKQIQQWWEKTYGNYRNYQPLDDSILNNFIVINTEYINKTLNEYINRAKNEISEKKQREQRELEQIHQEKLRLANKELDRLLTLKTRIRQQSRFYGNTEFKRLRLHPEELQRLWNDYNDRWIDFKQRNQPIRPKQLIEHVNIPETFLDKLKYYIKTHPDEKNPISYEQFEKMTRGWPNSLKSIKEWHQYYLENHPSNFKSSIDTKTSNIIGFKSPNKIKALHTLYPDKIAPDLSITSNFPLKINKKLYQLHKACPRGTYIIDLMFSEKFAYLVAINVNTRYLYVSCMNEKLFVNDFTTDAMKYNTYSRASKNAKTFIDNLDYLIKSGMNVKYLQGDGERAFNSIDAWTYYDKHGIIFTPVPRIQMGVYPDFMTREQKHAKTDPMHGSLGILDRVVRTLRDMAYNMKIGVIKPDDMRELVQQYNNAPHKTLSKYAGMMVTPNMVQNDPELEEFIVKRICQLNYDIINNKGFRLSEGTPVKLYNERDTLAKRRSVIQPGKHYIKTFKNGLYEVIDDNNKSQLIPRYKIDYR